MKGNRIQHYALISVLMPVFNREDYLEATLLSLQSQTHPQWELIAVDDGSSDRSCEILEFFHSRDPRIRWLRRTSPRKGANVCRNEALQICKGDYVLFLDSDDLLPADCLTRRYEIMKAHPELDAGVFGCSVFQEPQAAVPYSGCSRFNSAILNFLRSPVPWFITSPLWKREALRSSEGFSENLDALQDWEFHLRTLLSGKQIHAFPGEAPFLCRRGNTSISQQNRSEGYLNAFVDSALLVAEHPGMVDQPSLARRLLFKRTVFGLLRLARHGAAGSIPPRLKTLERTKLAPRILTLCLPPLLFLAAQSRFISRKR